VNQRVFFSFKAWTKSIVIREKHLTVRGKQFGSSGEKNWQFGGNILVVRGKQFGSSGETIWQIFW